jgi:hypothetical protein
LNIILYSTDCPKCKVIEVKLNQLNISYIIEKDIDKINLIAEEHNFSSAPILQVNQDFYNFNEAIKWLKEQSNEYRA